MRYEVDRADLITFAWSAPMRDLAAKVGISDVGLKKLLRAQGVALPPQGHWNRIHAGRTVPKPPLPPPRQIGQWPNAQVDDRFRHVISEAPDPPAEGPFASRDVPEDLADLYGKEFEAIGRVPVINNFSRVHPSLAPLIRYEAARREKARERGYLWSAGARYDAPFDQRRLRVLNAILLALAKRGGSGWVRERDEDFEVGINVGDSGAQLVIDEPSRCVRSRRYDRPPKNRPAATSLTVAIEDAIAMPFNVQWRDDAKGKVETKLREIVAALLAVSEANVRREIKRRHTWRAEEKIRQEKIAEMQRVEAQKRRLEALRASAEKLREADNIRALVSRVRSSPDIPETSRWAEWALNYADEIDPILNGEIGDSIE